ncbi:LPS assembly lipoprotein LptE [Aquabacterium sp.]|uniref:LPS-assembly lipoprotein LptE n=1 Tax=Aquabacterium sp. TaxID=1872578 RepID=UPI003D6CF03F
MNRRTFTLSLLALSASAAVSGLAGCGFELRRAPHMSFKSVQLSGFAANSPLAAELAKALEDAGVSVVESTAVAAAQQNLPAAVAASNPRILTSHVVLEALSDTREQAVASITAFSQVRDISLRTRFRFRLTRADGSDIIVPTELLLTSDLPYNEKDALAKIDESAAMHRAMQTDIVQQVMRRLAVVRPEQLAAP